jgi:hypothetical protein
VADADALRVADLRRACSVLLGAVECRFGKQINLSEQGVDHYWEIDLRAAYDMVEQPELQIDCGQATDDLAELASLLKRGPDHVVSVWHGAQHLTGLLRLLAYLDLRDVDRPRGH